LSGKQIYVLEAVPVVQWISTLHFYVLQGCGFRVLPRMLIFFPYFFSLLTFLFFRSSQQCGKILV